MVLARVALSRVKDPGGPFNGWWYSSDASITILRKAIYDPHIFPTSAPFNGTPPDEDWYRGNTDTEPRSMST